MIAGLDDESSDSPDRPIGRVHRLVTQNPHFATLHPLVDNRRAEIIGNAGDSPKPTLRRSAPCGLHPLRGWEPGVLGRSAAQADVTPALLYEVDWHEPSEADPMPRLNYQMGDRARTLSGNKGNEVPAHRVVTTDLGPQQHLH